MNIAKQRVAVLGGTSGIGYATAAAAAEQGAEVVVVSRDPERVRQAASRLGATGLAADLSDPPATLFDEIGPFDHLVYTAGEALTLMPVASIDPARAREFFGVRYFGALAAVRAALPHLRPGGSITLTTGTAGDRPSPGWSVASSICGAMDSLTRALAVELAPIRVNAVKPGVTRSPLWGDGEDVETLYATTAATVPLGRVGEVSDVAGAYLYLMGQPFTTGTILTVDGGALLA
ncbi:SDR family oxidoreductase [Paractinoplanes deccanensis]|uniref:SDR family oxidoreductase n=1 Tax=Paractinoplanes deccanensis TaxID=113561 RepID=UPI00194390ED|nr:SDR family oxidoreductase [Actinoplanes deccanensis]